MAEKYLCPVCLKPITVTAALKFRKHAGDDGETCPCTGLSVPSYQVVLGPIADGLSPSVPEEGRDIATCGECGRKVPLDLVEGVMKDHDRTLRGGERCPKSSGSTETFSASPTTRPSPTPFQQAATTTSRPFQHADNGKRQAEPIVPMTTLGAEVAARIKETFYAYGNRRTTDNRSAQTTLGPSEIGSPCDRRLALSLLQVPPVNPGGDGWAAFVGTCVHEGVADMFQWADGSTGRYAVETGLAFPNTWVPKGTGDLLDRTMCMFLDHKMMGQWSLNKLRAKGPSPTYLVQVNTYAYGARLKGEKVDHVAIVAWPRDKSSLDDLYVWTAEYDPNIARDALARVDRIAQATEGHPATAGPLDIGLTFPMDNSDCRYCPFHAPGDSEGTRGCNGRQ